MRTQLLSISDLQEMSTNFGKNWNEHKSQELDEFSHSDELRYLPLKAFFWFAKNGNWEAAVLVYLNQQDKMDRTNGKFHAWMVDMCLS